MKFLLVIAMCTGLFASGIAQSRGVKINQQVSGVGSATMIDTNGDGIFATALTFEHRGAPGRSTSTAMVEQTAPTPGDCPDGLLTSHSVQGSYVQTFSDLSMLYSVETAGRTCFDPETFEITCEAEGLITGGTGRFEGATGSWTVACEIFIVGETVNAFTGKLKGEIDVPDRGDD